MALFIRDAEVDALAEELRALTKAKSKTEAVRVALAEAARRARSNAPAANRFARAKAMADALGPSRPDFDMKAFRDAMWDDT